MLHMTLIFIASDLLVMGSAMFTIHFMLPIVIADKILLVDTFAPSIDHTSGHCFSSMKATGN